MDEEERRSLTQIEGEAAAWLGVVSRPEGRKRECVRRHTHSCFPGGLGTLMVQLLPLKRTLIY